MRERRRFLVTFYRQGIYENDKNGDIEDNVFFVTDYFDKVTIKSIGQNEGMGTFLGMQDDFREMNDVIAVHNYAMYTDCYDALQCDAVFKPNLDFPFLSLIHVYITADVLARLEGDMTEKQYMDFFEKDLRKIVSLCEKDSMSILVFRMFSSSDFMVIVRSKEPECAFEVSSRIRKQLISKRKNINSSLALYKTYTILTIQGRDVSYIENMKQNKTNSNSIFAIRGRYSNQYWNENGASLVKHPSSIKLLNGRYDFLIHLKSDEFQCLLPQLCMVKGIITNGVKSEYMTQEQPTEEFCYIQDLLKHKYLSYVNERFFLGKVLENAVVESMYIEDIYLDDQHNTEEFLYERLNERCNIILDKIGRNDDEGIRSKCIKKCPSNTTINTSAKLLGALVNLCRNVNSLSDTRVYVVALLEQLETVVDAANEWLEVGDAESYQFFDTMEKYMRDSVVALECYANVIRSNNFQTLQSPRYNIISGCSIEKILIGYSRFLNYMMDYSINKLTENHRAVYLSIMIPNLECDSPEVEVCFREYSCDGDKVETEIDDRDSKKYLMIVKGPVTKELVSGWNIITSLFHEMAHNFRYESREERNKVIARIIIEEIAEDIVKILFGDLNENRLQLNEIITLICLFQESFADTIYLTMYEIFKEYINASLSVFKENLKRDLKKFMQSLKGKKHMLRELALNYFQITNEYITQDSMMHINNILEEIEKLEKISLPINSETLIDLKDIIRKQLYAYKASCIKALDENDIVESPNMLKDAKVIIEDMTRIMDSQLMEYVPLHQDYIIDKNDFMKQLYKNLYERCQPFGSIETIFVAPEKECVKLLRKFGLDENLPQNRRQFNELFAKSISSFDFHNMDFVNVRISSYREETADLYMCAMCDLDLKSYLVLCAGTFPRSERGYKIGYIKRFCHIVLVQWGIQEEKADKVDWEEVHNRLISQFKDIYKWITKKEYVTVQSEETLNLIKCFNEFLKCNSEASDLKKGIVLLILQVLQVYEQLISWLKRSDYFLDDYLRGKKRYKKLFQDFSADDDYMIQFIRAMCQANKKYLCSLLENNIVAEEYHKVYEDFILTMFHYDKLYHAKKGGKRNND